MDLFPAGALFTVGMYKKSPSDFWSAGIFFRQEGQFQNEIASGKKKSLVFDGDVFFGHQFGQFPFAHITDGNDPPFLFIPGRGFAAFPAED